MAVNFPSPALLFVWLELWHARVWRVYAQSSCRAATPQEGVLGAVADLGMSSPNDFFFLALTIIRHRYSRPLSEGADVRSRCSGRAKRPSSVFGS